MLYYAPIYNIIIIVYYVITECNAPQAPYDYIHGRNINNYIGCTIIKGTIRILSFKK